jgi:hypothetical protein
MLVKKIYLALLLLAAFGFTSCSKSSASENPVSSQSSETVLFWNDVAYNAFGGVQYQHSLMASRINVLVQLAIHDALNGIEEKYSRYAFNGKDTKADPRAAAASAAHTILLAETPDRKSFLDSALMQSLASVKDGEAKARGIAFGKEAALAVMAKRGNDGAAGDVVGPIQPSGQPGVYQAVAPFTFLFAPHWENVKLFSLNSKHQFRSKPHPAVNSAEYAASFNEVKIVGEKNSAVRTPNQTSYAKFWYEFSEAGWNRVARTVIKDKNMNMLDAARLLALVDMAMADAYIAGWDSKIHYNFWRPFTAIRKADIDGNNSTTVDAAWEPLEVTPPVQDYPSTHSALGNAAATVLARVIGDNTSFSMPSPTALPGSATRSFQSFRQAANENADSRVMAGIHFRFACVAGQKLGDDIGNWTVENHLKPLK